MKKLLYLMMCLAAISMANAEIVEHLTFDVDGTASVGTDATLVGGASIVTGGIAGGALSLDGVDDHAITEGYKCIGGSDPRTISLWVKTAVNQANGTFFIGWGDTGGGSRVRYDFGLQSGTTDQMRLELNAGATTSATGTTITDDAWHHLASTWDGTTMTFYLNGAPYGTAAPGTVNTILTEDLVIGTGIRQAFAGNTTARWTNGLIDDVQIYDTVLSGAEIAFLFANPGTPFVDIAYGPEPYNGEPSVAIDTQLSWQPPTTFDNATYNIYFGSSEPNYTEANYGLTLLNTGGPQAATSIDPSPAGDLDNDTTYYWVVDSYEPNTPSDILHAGEGWTFTTIAATPIIDTEPVSETAASVDLYIEATNAEVYEWYQVGTPDTLVQTTGTLGTPGSVSDTYTTSTEGFYYCIVKNTAGSDTSQTVHVMTPRLVGHWNFDENLVSTVDAIHTGSYVDPNVANDPPTPVYTAVSDANNLPGKGQAFIFEEDPLHVQIGGDADDFNFYPQGYTVNTWIKTTESAYGATVTKQALDNSAGFLMSHNGGTAIHAIRPGSATTTAAGAINDDQWHMITGSYDAATGLVSLFIDGELVKTATKTNVPVNDQPLVFGAELTDGSVPYTGLLDEVSIWNYPRTKEQIGQEYYDITGIVPCINEFDGSVYDFDGNCIVDLADFVEFAQFWLDNGLLPL